MLTTGRAKRRPALTRFCSTRGVPQIDLSQLAVSQARPRERGILMLRIR